MSEVLEQVFLTKCEAAVKLEICTATLESRIRAGEIPVYRDGRDRRVVLIRAEDVEKARQPKLKNGHRSPFGASHEDLQRLAAAEGK